MAVVSCACSEERLAQRELRLKVSEAQVRAERPNRYGGRVRDHAVGDFNVHSVTGADIDTQYVQTSHPRAVRSVRMQTSPPAAVRNVRIQAGPSAIPALKMGAFTADLAAALNDAEGDPRRRSVVATVPRDINTQPGDVVVLPASSGDDEPSSPWPSPSPSVQHVPMEVDTDTTVVYPNRRLSGGLSGTDASHCFVLKRHTEVGLTHPNDTAARRLKKPSEHDGHVHDVDGIGGPLPGEVVLRLNSSGPRTQQEVLAALLVLGVVTQDEYDSITRASDGSDDEADGDGDADDSSSERDRDSDESAASVPKKKLPKALTAELVQAGVARRLQTLESLASPRPPSTPKPTTGAGGAGAGTTAATPDATAKGEGGDPRAEATTTPGGGDGDGSGEAASPANQAGAMAVADIAVTALSVAFQQAAADARSKQRSRRSSLRKTKLKLGRGTSERSTRSTPLRSPTPRTSRRRSVVGGSRRRSLAGSPITPLRATHRRSSSRSVRSTTSDAASEARVRRYTTHVRQLRVQAPPEWQDTMRDLVGSAATERVWSSRQLTATILTTYSHKVRDDRTAIHAAVKDGDTPSVASLPQQVLQEFQMQFGAPKLVALRIATYVCCGCRACVRNTGTSCHALVCPLC